MTSNDPNSAPRTGDNSRPTVNGLAIASLVLGIVWLMWIGSILALVFGYVAKRQIEQSPHRQSGRELALAGIVLGWVGVGALLVMLTLSMTGVFTMPDIPMTNRMGIGDDFSSNGERIFMTGDTDSGESITFEEGPREGMMSSGLACADCHGADGRGGERQMMMETFYAADIRWATLTGDHADDGNDAESGPPPYTPETVRTAITQGIGSGARPLDTVMPRWEMSRDDLDDLVEYLQTLGE